ncbi:hypothetical protein [Allomesorhizobium camelthorni]|uniref:Uncharacterized protein n=1 Tax=Allomesorhizobium camelthorni TaxID=475069 RepID=A0A6G4W7U0_9HYPH|nr:hypothetical protein [Mesorhizobium camelthorni]NGO50669.1 hypothetical protein [Mesorhizobium camelthorni]
MHTRSHQQAAGMEYAQGGKECGQIVGWKSEEIVQAIDFMALKILQGAGICALAKVVPVLPSPLWEKGGFT